MAARGVDAAGRLSGAAVEAAGYQFVARYLDFGVSRVKTFLGRAEVDDLLRHEVAILPVWEIGTEDVLAGRAAAVAQAKLAARDLAGLDMASAVMWWTADRDVTPADLPVLAYARGWADVIPVARLGVYGDADTLDAVVGGGLASYGWQSGARSWSGGRVSAHAHIVQLVGGVAVGGVQCDVNEVRAGVTDYGQWPRPATPDRDGDDMAVHRLYQDPGSPLVVAGGPGYWRGMRSQEERDALAGIGGFGEPARPNARQWDLLRTTLVRLAPVPVDVDAVAAAVVATLTQTGGGAAAHLTPAQVAAAVVAGMHQVLAAGADATDATP